ncbi:hypothetical protein BC629DRAFT_310765 [Irpex lacteus]|nr:hypothetical protein BC629DRAFT_310765 [Irpex lacteus]
MFTFNLQPSTTLARLHLSFPVVSRSNRTFYSSLFPTSAYCIPTTTLFFCIYLSVLRPRTSHFASSPLQMISCISLSTRGVSTFSPQLFDLLPPHPTAQLLSHSTFIFTPRLHSLAFTSRFLLLHVPTAPSTLLFIPFIPTNSLPSFTLPLPPFSSFFTFLLPLRRTFSFLSFIFVTAVSWHLLSISSFFTPTHVTLFLHILSPL